MDGSAAVGMLPQVGVERRAHHVGAEARGGPITQPALAVRVAVEEAQRSVQQQRHAPCFQSDSAFLCRVQNPQDSPGFSSIPKSGRKDV